MKIKKIMLTSALLLSNFAHAGIIVRTPTGSPLDICSALTGAWNGSGTITATGLECEYTGTVQITPKDDTSFSSTLALSKVSGSGIFSGLCTDLKKTLAGACNNGAVTINDDGVDLSGSLNSAGNSATLTGTVTIDGIKVNVENMVLTKQ